MLGIKSKYRSQLKTPEHDLRCAVANVSPRINEFVAKKQVHPSITFIGTVTMHNFLCML